MARTIRSHRAGKHRKGGGRAGKRGYTGAHRAGKHRR